MEIRCVGVVGAGIMGMGIAQVSAQYGYSVIMQDVAEEAIAKGLARARKNLDGQIAKGRMTVDEVEAVFSRIKTTTDLSDIAPADFVIEAVFEDMAIKKQVFAALESIVTPKTILATNTSILSPTEIGSAVKSPERTIGLHFFNPAPIMKLVEVTPGMLTSQETVTASLGFCRSIGKMPVVAKESPGGIVSRVLNVMRQEAVELLQEGVATKEDIDTAMKLGAGFPMGPLELLDLVGIDLAVQTAENLYRELGNPKYRPHPLLRKMQRAGLLGRKTGRGFYEYAD